MIAISYRREDSLPIAGRLHDRLQAKFGKQNIFMDFDSIRPGLDFRNQIKETIERSSVVLAIIGPHWLGDKRAKHRRIDEPADFVRIEIAQALKQGVPVIPVLVNNTPMPKPERLPADIKELSFRHAVPLDSGLDFHQHADRLIASIEALIGRESSTKATIESTAGDKSHGPTRRARLIVIAGTAVLFALLIASVLWFLGSRNRSRNPERVDAQFIEKQQTLVTPSPAAPVNSLTTPAIVAVPNPPAISVAPTSSPNLRTTGSSLHSGEEQVRQLLRDYFAALSRHDLEAVISKFADTVNYQGQGLRTKNYIRADANNYLRKWNRIFFDVRDVEVSQTPQGDFVARFDSPFVVGEPNTPDKTGISSNVWMLRENAQGELQIISQQESVLNGAARPAKNHKRR